MKNIFKKIVALVVWLRPIRVRFELRSKQFLRKRKVVAKTRKRKIRLYLRNQPVPQGAEEIDEDYNLRLTRRALWFIFAINIAFGYVMGVRVGVYAVTFRHQYGTDIYYLMSAYFVTMLLLNVWLGTIADGLLGRRIMFLFGLTMIMLAGLFHMQGNFADAMVGELMFGVGMASVTGILGAWLRWNLEQLHGSRYREHYRNAANAIGIRMTVGMLFATASGSSLTQVNPTWVWVSTSVVATIMGVISYYFMFFRKIETKEREKETPTKLFSLAKKEVLANKLVRQYFELGSIQQAAWALVGIAWYTLYAEATGNWMDGKYVAATAMAVTAAGYWAAYRAEQAGRYTSPTGIDASNQDDVSEKQSEIDFLWMRNANLAGGLLLVISAVTAFWFPGLSLGIFLTAYFCRGIFQRKFTGSINQAIGKKSRKAATTILSLFETFAALTQLTAIMIGGFVEKSPIQNEGNFILAGTFMIGSGILLWRRSRKGVEGITKVKRKTISW